MTSSVTGGRGDLPDLVSSLSLSPQKPARGSLGGARPLPPSHWPCLDIPRDGDIVVLVMLASRRLVSVTTDGRPDSASVFGRGAQFRVVLGSSGTLCLQSLHKDSHYLRLRSEGVVDACGSRQDALLRCSQAGLRGTFILQSMGTVAGVSVAVLAFVNPERPPAVRPTASLCSLARATQMA